MNNADKKLLTETILREVWYEEEHDGELPDGSPVTIVPRTFTTPMDGHDIFVALLEMNLWEDFCWSKTVDNAFNYIDIGLIRNDWLRLYPETQNTLVVKWLREMVL